MKGNKEETTREESEREWVGQKSQSHDRGNPQTSHEAQRTGRKTEEQEKECASSTDPKTENLS